MLLTAARREFRFDIEPVDDPVAFGIYFDRTAYYRSRLQLHEPDEREPVDFRHPGTDLSNRSAVHARSSLPEPG